MYNKPFAKDSFPLATLANFPYLLWNIRLLQLFEGITAIHSLNTAYIMAEIARILEIMDPRIATLAGSQHDLGKNLIAKEILLKNSRPTDDEWVYLRLHPQIGATLLRKEKSLKREVRKIMMASAMTHHERWNGSGYPRGLKGEEIPLIGRLTAIADVCDALLAKRSYKPTLSLEKVLEIMWDGVGSHFDPNLAPKILEIIPGIIRGQT